VTGKGIGHCNGKLHGLVSLCITTWCFKFVFSFLCYPCDMKKIEPAVPKSKEGRFLYIPSSLCSYCYSTLNSPVFLTGRLNKRSD
jgi:hypothetical protein